MNETTLTGIVKHGIFAIASTLVAGKVSNISMNAVAGSGIEPAVGISTYVLTSGFIFESLDTLDNFINKQINDKRGDTNEKSI